MQWFLILASLGALYVLWCLQRLSSNFAKASASGFATYVTLVNPLNPFWMAFSVPWEPTLRRILPSFLYNRIRQSIYGWEYREKATGLSGRRGRPEPGFILVNTGKNELWVEDPEIAHRILSRRKDFIQLDIAILLMGIFGPNVITSEGDDWSRHRKLVAPILNERISDLVWREAVKQADEMAHYYLGNNGGKTNETIDGLRAIAVHVLGSAGYGVTQPWKEEVQEAAPGHKVTYMGALNAVIDGFVLAALMPTKILSLPIMPENLRTLGASMQEFPVYSKEMLETERKLAASTSQPRNNLMSTLLKASDAEKNQISTGSLSEPEIIGNLFQFSLAGFDTTANTLAYAVTRLATDPEWQDWIIEEIDHVMKQDDSADYEKTFPKLGRCLAVMYETLRLYAPLAHISRATATPQTITASGKSYHIPGNCSIYINVDGIQCDESIWGPDAREFRPSRWLSKESTLDNPIHINMPRGAFLPWSGGPRICPGMKMAQVEFVAVMLTVFRQARIVPVTQGDETREMAAERIMGLVRDSQPKITLQMKRPKDVVLKWELR